MGRKKRQYKKLKNAIKNQKLAKNSKMQSISNSAGDRLCVADGRPDSGGRPDPGLARRLEVCPGREHHPPRPGVRVCLRNSQRQK
jgi:hypothetical protein